LINKVFRQIFSMWNLLNFIVMFKTKELKFMNEDWNLVQTTMPGRIGNLKHQPRRKWIPNLNYVTPVKIIWDFLKPEYYGQEVFFHSLKELLWIWGRNFASWGADHPHHPKLTSARGKIVEGKFQGELTFMRRKDFKMGSDWKFFWWLS